MDNEELKKRLDILEIKIDLIIDILRMNVEPNCEKMNKHIDFIDNVYDKLKTPLDYVSSMINSKCIEE